MYYVQIMIAGNGLEARTPFLGKNFVRTYMSIPSDVRNIIVRKKQEKYLLRELLKIIYQKVYYTRKRG